MNKKANKYRITLEPVSLLNGEEHNYKALQFEFENHDEVFSIIKRLKEKDPFNNIEQATEFALGLKLFSEVMIKNRAHPLFEELAPAFKTFMQKLKAS